MVELVAVVGEGVGCVTGSAYSRLPTRTYHAAATTRRRRSHLGTLGIRIYLPHRFNPQTHSHLGGVAFSSVILQNLPLGHGLPHVHDTPKCSRPTHSSPTTNTRTNIQRVRLGIVSRGQHFQRVSPPSHLPPATASAGD